MNDAFKEFLKNNFTSVCFAADVLEIAPMNGDSHTQAILDSIPTNLVQVEANAQSVKELSVKFANKTKVIHDDIYHYLNVYHKFDVVMCCGLLYHLHSPLYLLELIVNQTDPKYIILDSAECPHEVALFDYEIINIPGNLQTIGNWKSCQLRTVLHLETINTALKNLGYKQIFIDQNIERFFDQSFKSNFWMGMWEKINE